FIARNGHGAVPSQDAPGSGALMTKVDEKEVPLPLKHTEVRAFIQDCLGTVEVSQQFQNPYSSKIEAVYVFPLPHNAAINEFVMTIGERRIRGIIRERKEAEQIYQDARRQGFVASLLTEERPNIFTQSVANIEPGKEIDVNNKYFVLRYRVAGERIKSSLLTQRDERGGYFTLMLYPPNELAALTRQPLELVFVLDCSGSMNGRPIEQAKAAVERGLRLLRAGD